MKKKSITALDDLCNIMNELGLKLDRATEAFNTLRKTPVKRDNNHPFAKYFKVKKITKQ